MLMSKVEYRLSRLKQSRGLNTAQYYSRAKKLNNECGCTLAGIFFTAALIGISFYVLFWYSSISFKMVFFGLLLSFAFGILGKVLGLMTAWFRLLLLYRTLVAHEKEVVHVNMH